LATTTKRSPTRLSALDRYFGITEAGSSVRTEVVGGLVIFLTMAYIMFVNPGILSSVKDSAGNTLNFNQVFSVTALGAGLATLTMGLYARKPFGLAPGMGINAFVTFGLVGAGILTWPNAMGVIVTEGLVILLLVIIKWRGTAVREIMINAIPHDLKLAIGVGIGIFLTLIGFVNAGVVVKGSGTLVAMTPHYRGWPLVIFAVGLVMTGAFMVRKMRGALLYGIILTTILATVVNKLNDYSVFKDGSARWPHSWASPDFGLVGAFSFDFWSVLGFASGVAILLSVLLSDFFDTAGTVIGIGEKAGMLDENRQLKDMDKVLQVDSGAAALGGAISASSITTYVESSSGVIAGARTGLAAVVVGLLFLASLTLAPIAGMVPAVATAPALVIVGAYMMSLAKGINWSDPLIAIPAFVCCVLMAFTYSITNGVGALFVLYAAIALFSGKGKQVHPLMYIVAAVFCWYFWHGIV
jgi:AGZA family xanthine/uracil permease-like MFS transporter